MCENVGWGHGCCLGQEALDQIRPFFKVSLRPAPNFKHPCCPQNWSKQTHLRFSVFQFHIRKLLNPTPRSVPELDMIWPTRSAQASTCFMAIWDLCCMEFWFGGSTFLTPALLGVRQNHLAWLVPGPEPQMRSCSPKRGVPMDVNLRQDDVAWVTGGSLLTTAMF